VPLTEAPIPLEDVADVRGFVIWQVGKSDTLAKGLTTDAEREEAVNEGVAIVYELHGDWDPLRCARFSAFLLTYLPKRLVSWYRINLRQSGRGSWSGSTGSYKYHGMVSIDAMEAGIEDFDFEEGTASHRYGSRSDSALVSHGAEDEAGGEALDDLLAVVSGAPA
jgi:hypothetical protein